MAKSPVKSFQQELVSVLRVLFSGVPIEKEWAAMRRADGLYSPRLDIAVGPFATGESNCVPKFDRLLEEHQDFLLRLYEHHLANIRESAAPGLRPDFEQVALRNRNARCFLAIEIENQVSRKHLMGGAINAAALGRIGIAVGWTTEKVEALVRLRSYLLFLASVGKNTFDPANLLILSKDQLHDTLKSLTAKVT